VDKQNSRTLGVLQDCDFCIRRKDSSSANTSWEQACSRSRPRSPRFRYPHIDDKAYERNQGKYLIVTLKSDKPPLFLTDSLGNTFTSGSATYGWSLTPEEEEVEYENTNKDKLIGEPKTVELVPGRSFASIMTAAGTALGTITIEGMAKQLTLRKNKIAIEILNTINVQLDLAVEYAGLHTRCWERFHVYRQSMA